MKKLAVFLSSGEPSFEIKADLEQIAHFLAEQKICMLYGGGKLGLMGYLSHKVKEYDGFVEGITVEMFHKKNIPLTILILLKLKQIFMIEREN